MAGIIILLIWAACGVVAYGLTFAYFQKEFALISKEKVGADVLLAAATAILGPFGVVICFLVGEGCEHGLLFRPLSDEQRRELLKAEYPHDPHMWD